MPRKPNNAIEAARRAGYKAGWDDRNQRSIQDGFSFWNWADWFVYVFVTVAVALAALAIFGLLTLWISWASDHRPHCRITSDGTQWCTDGR